jgi:hypothetical protein
MYDIHIKNYMYYYIFNEQFYMIPRFQVGGASWALQLQDDLFGLDVGLQDGGHFLSPNMSQRFGITGGERRKMV